MTRLILTRYAAELFSSAIASKNRHVRFLTRRR